MPVYLAYIAQSADNGFDWSNLYWLFILVVLPAVNAIKDKFVKRAESKRQGQDAEAAAKSRRVPKLRPVDPILPLAKPFHVGVTQEKPAPPAPVARPVPKMPPPPPLVQPLSARPATRAPEPAVAECVPQPRLRRRKVPAEVKPGAAPRRTVAGVQVGLADPNVDIHMADPSVRVRQADPGVDVSAGRPHVQVRDLSMANVDLVGLSGVDLVSSVSAIDLRRAVILSEILRPPLALRSSGGWHEHAPYEQRLQ